LPWPETVQTKPRHALRNGTYNAGVAVVAVQRATGKVRVTRFMIGQDNGIALDLAVNLACYHVSSPSSLSSSSSACRT
jgi:hypothetical protein